MKGELRHGWKSGLDPSKDGFMLKVSFKKKKLEPYSSPAELVKSEFQGLSVENSNQKGSGFGGKALNF